LTNSLNTLKNSKPQKLTKNPKKIQESKKDSKTISKIGISIIASVLLSQNLAALPAGGKFIHGSGSISKNGNTMDITGNNRNHVIAWGGGFNINNGETVKFNGSGKSFLNLDYSNKASKILGTLNGNGNNIYLVNPSGVLIGEGGKVNNVGRFVASTTSLDEALKDFTQLATNNGDQNAVNFSPVFTRGSLKGNVINMGTINANNIMLVGNEVRNLTSNGNKDVQGKYDNTGNLHIIGNKIFLDVEGVQNKKNIRLTGTNGIGQSNPQITVQMAMSTFKANGHKDWITKDYSIDGVQVGSGEQYVDRIITIGGTGGWNDFANAWNNGDGITRDIEEFKLIGKLDFSGTDFVSVGKPQGAGFNKIFNGNGYTMSNIKLDNNDASNNNGTIIAGIFNKVGGGTIKNLTIDRVTADITTNQAPTLHFGAFAGQINGGTIENVTLNNINIKGSIDYSYANGPTNDNGYMGGFAGVINRGNIKNVSLNNIEQVFLYSNQTIGATLYVGGFAGRIANASNGSSTNINGVILNNIGRLRTDVRADWGAKVNTLIGGFTAELGSGNSISNAFLYYTANSVLMPALDSDGRLDGREYVHTFYHAMNGGGSSLNNIKIHYSNNHTDKTYDKVQVGSLPSDVRFGYTAKGMIEGIPGSYGSYYLRGEKATGYYQGKVAFSDYTNKGGNFQNIVNGYNGVKVNGGNYSWVKQERISNTYPMNSSLNTSGDYT
ncbi:filamentous hemagglutinin N-terminal domain-containing protein, partial [Helicobacter pullorum]|uniref:two-partner secretion domain-containing protein n=1 Tax=Helicobacter pullorum TaxID=35818 RepID=UPI00241E46E5